MNFFLQNNLPRSHGFTFYIGWYVYVITLVSFSTAFRACFLLRCISDTVYGEFGICVLKSAAIIAPISHNRYYPTNKRILKVVNNLHIKIHTTKKKNKNLITSFLSVYFNLVCNFFNHINLHRTPSIYVYTYTPTNGIWFFITWR